MTARHSPTTELIFPCTLEVGMTLFCRCQLEHEYKKAHILDTRMLSGKRMYYVHFDEGLLYIIYSINIFL